MKTNKLISAVLAAVMTFSSIGAISFAEGESESDLITVDIKQENGIYVLNNYDGGDGGGYRVKVNTGLDGYSVAMQNYGYANFIIPDADCVEKIYYSSSFTLRDTKNNGTFWYSVDNFIEDIPEAGIYTYATKSGSNTIINENEEERDIAYNIMYRISQLTNANYNYLANYTRPGSSLATKLYEIKWNGGFPFTPVNDIDFDGTQNINTDLTLDITSNVLEKVNAKAAENDGNVEIAFLLGTGENVRQCMNTDKTKLTVFYDRNKLFAAEIDKAASAEDLRTVVEKYNDYIGVKTDIFTDMSELYTMLYETIQDKTRDEYTYEYIKSAYNAVVDNIIVKNSYANIMPYEVTGNEHIFNFPQSYDPKADGYSVYLSVDVENTSGTCTFSAGNAQITVGNGKMTLSYGTETAEAEVSENFNGTITLKVGADSVMTAVASNDTERAVVSMNFDDYFVNGATVNSDGVIAVSNLEIQQYPMNYGKETTEKLDLIFSLIEKGERESAISNYDNAIEDVESMSDGIIKDELNSYMNMLSVKVDYARNELRKATVEAAIAKATESKKFADYEEAVELAKVVTDKEMINELNTSLAALKAMMDSIVPTVSSVSANGSWQVGATLTAEITLEDNCGNGDGYICEWLVNGVSKGSGETFTIDSSHRGATIILRVTPKNNAGIKGTAQQSLEIKIPSASNTSSSGSSGGGGGIGSGYVVTKPNTNNDEPAKDPETPTIENPSAGFKDVSGHWAENTINNMMKKGIINGVSENSFEPDRKITRAEFLTVALRAAGMSEKTYTNEFTDVNADDWYSGAVAAAYSLGLIAGFDGKFNPGAEITRQEMAKLLVSVYEMKNGTVISGEQNAQYNDLPNVSDWAVEYVNKAYNAKLMMGDNNNAFNPNSSATRAEAAAAVERLLNE